MQLRLFAVVQVKSFLTSTGFAVIAKQLLQFFKLVGRFAEMTEVNSGLAGLRHFLPHCGTIITMETVAFDYHGVYLVAMKN